MPIYLAIGITLFSFLAMEGVAWFTHKYIMHGFLWYLHEDHHTKETEGHLEKNDAFFLIFAIPGIILIFTGVASMDIRFFLGLGIALYGMAYFFVHDIFIHGRFPFLKSSNSTYFKAIRRAHKVHHRHIQKEDGECFGMLYVPLKYYREARRMKKMQSEA